MGIGMKEPLVDQEVRRCVVEVVMATIARQGYPRGDVDVAAARTHRNRVVGVLGSTEWFGTNQPTAVLSNDHKELSARIEKLLHELHVQRVQPPQRAATPPIAADIGAGLRAFANIDEVTEGSPAAAAGVMVGDKLLALGRVTATSGGMAALPGLLQVRVHDDMMTVHAHSVHQSSEGTALRALVRRDGRSVTLQLTPQRWGGRGLLGCHLVPLL